MEQRIVDVENVSIKFNLSSEKIDSMKDYLVKRLKGQIDNRRSIKTDKGKRKSIWKYCTAY